MPVNSDDEDTVLSEFPVILMRPNNTETVDRLQFNHQKPANMEDCTAKHKQQVRHLEVDFSSSNYGEKKSFFEGTYCGESTSTPDQLGVHACSFFHDGKMYLMPVDNTYEMQRRIEGSKKLSDVEKAKIDDSRLAALNAPATANPVRVRFARPETEWQKKRREQSANYRQQLIDQDPWITLTVRDNDPQFQFSQQVAAAEEKEALHFDTEKLPIL